MSINQIGIPEGIRTPDPQIRNLMLYPTELQEHFEMAAIHPLLRLATPSQNP